MSARNWISPVKIIDSKVLGLNLSIADDFGGGDTHLSLTMNTSSNGPILFNGDSVCKCVLEAVGDWSIDEEGIEPAFAASCKLGITIAIPEESLASASDGEKDMLVMANAISIAYGKIRAIIENVTAESVVGKQTLPAIDPYAFVASLSPKNESKDSE